MSDVSLSVVTSTIGRRATVMRKLDALRQQTLAPTRFEWVICIDGVDDGTEAAIREARLPFEVKIVRHARTRGPGPGRNAAAALAEGGVLYLSDDDCLPEPNTLARHLAAQADPCVAVGGLTFRPPRGRETHWRPRRARYWNVNGANASLPAGAFRGVGGFDETLSGYGGEDVLLGYRLVHHGLSVRTLPGAEAVHLGPDPASGVDLGKAASAGRNAARIAAKYPRLALRLGVQPWLLRLKLAVLPAVAYRGRSRAAHELAYARGAWEVRSKTGREVEREASTWPVTEEERE